MGRWCFVILVFVSAAMGGLQNWEAATYYALIAAIIPITKIAWKGGNK